MLCSKDKRDEGNPLFLFNPSTGNLLQILLHDNLDIEDLNNADEIADEYLLMAIKCQSDCNSSNDIKNIISRSLKVSKNARAVAKNYGIHPVQSRPSQGAYAPDSPPHKPWLHSHHGTLKLNT
ncbi:Uncharacterized protein Fot_21259 [Forsythia ovata]|uniref:Uncharacterized protein n=1 Tax=Forsythia ovata TaxID=205694 RepID=A0ABD1UUB2_9LAMI